MVRTLDGDLEFDVVPEPRGSDRLRGFVVGPRRYDKEVTTMVADLHRGNIPPRATVLAMTHEGHTAGVCAWYPRPLPSEDLTLPDDVYIHTLGLSESHRERSLEDGTWLSSALMRGALRQIRGEVPTTNMPASWVYISPFNKKSHRLFRRHGYATRAPIAGHDIIRLRPGRLDPDLFLLT